METIDWLFWFQLVAHALAIVALLVMHTALRDYKKRSQNAEDYIAIAKANINYGLPAGLTTAQKACAQAAREQLAKALYALRGWKCP